MLRRKLKSKLESRDYKTLKSAMGKMPILRKLVMTLLKPEVLSPEAFYNHLASDLILSKEPIDIYSPFTLKPRVEEFLAVAKRSKAPITVYTKPPEDFKKNQKYWQNFNIALLKKVGVEVITRPKMHEKAVIVGGNIAYFGSLNALSRLNEEAGGDYMLRYESPLVSSLIEDFLREVGHD